MTNQFEGVQALLCIFWLKFRSVLRLNRKKNTKVEEDGVKGSRSDEKRGYDFDCYCKFVNEVDH